MVRFLEICFADTSANMLTIQLVFDTSRHISIGIAAGDMKLSRLSGWERNSWGYHGDFFFGGGGGEEWEALWAYIRESVPLLPFYFDISYIHSSH